MCIYIYIYICMYTWLYIYIYMRMYNLCNLCIMDHQSSAFDVADDLLGRTRSSD